MFYEEKLIEGMWCYRTNPNDLFSPMTRSMLNEKLTQERNESKEITFNELNNIVRDFADNLKGDFTITLFINLFEKQLKDRYGFEINRSDQTPEEFMLDADDVDLPIKDIIESVKEDLPEYWKVRK